MYSVYSKECNCFKQNMAQGKLADKGLYQKIEPLSFHLSLTHIHIPDSIYSAVKCNLILIYDPISITMFPKFTLADTFFLILASKEGNYILLFTA